jgi:hypothetical protein
MGYRRNMNESRYVFWRILFSRTRTSGCVLVPRFGRAHGPTPAPRCSCCVVARRSESRGPECHGDCNFLVRRIRTDSPVLPYSRTGALHSFVVYITAPKTTKHPRLSFFVLPGEGRGALNRIACCLSMGGGGIFFEKNVGGISRILSNFY